MMKPVSRQKDPFNGIDSVTFSSNGQGRQRRRPGIPSLLTGSILVLLVVFLSACGSTSTGASTSNASSSPTSQVKKHDTCNAQSTLPADVPANGTFDTGANVITTFKDRKSVV